MQVSFNETRSMKIKPNEVSNKCRKFIKSRLRVLSQENPIPNLNHYRATELKTETETETCPVNIFLR